MSEVLLNTSPVLPATPHELVRDWRQHHAVPARHLVTNAEPLAVLRRPGAYEQPKAVLSLDRDEVLHMTGGACIAHYTGDTSWAQRLTNRYDLAGMEDDGTIDASVLHVTNNHLALPVSDYLEVRDELRDLRAAGAYVVATTAIIPGCERAVVRSLARDYEGCFDGVIFSRGHLEVGSTKPRSLTQALGAVGIALHDMAVGHVDDSSRHVWGFLGAQEQFGSVHLAMPDCEGEPLESELDVYRAGSTYDAIKLVREGMGI